MSMRWRPLDRHFALRLSEILAICLVSGASGSAAIARHPVLLEDWPDGLTTELVSRHLTPEGRTQWVRRFTTSQTTDQAALELTRQAGALHESSKVVEDVAAGWRVLSFWHRAHLIVTQLRSGRNGSVETEGLITVTSFVGNELPTTDQAVRLPRWWPRMNEPWSRLWRDDDRRVLTVLGWMDGSLDLAEQRFVDAASVPGLRLTNRARATVDRGGLLLIFSGHRMELTLTLTSQGDRTGVVAHLLELQS